MSSSTSTSSLPLSPSSPSSPSFSWELSQMAITNETKVKEEEEKLRKHQIVMEKYHKQKKRNPQISPSSPLPNISPSSPLPPSSSPISTSTQTLPFSPDYIMDNNPHTPSSPYIQQLLSISSSSSSFPPPLSPSATSPLSNNSLSIPLPLTSSGLSTLQYIHNKSLTTQSLPPLHSTSLLPLRRRMMERMEREEWERRKGKIVEEEKGKIEIFHKLLGEREDNNSIIEGKRLLYHLSRVESDFTSYKSKLDLEKNKMNRMMEKKRVEEMRRMEYLTSSSKGDNRSSGDRKRDIIEEYADFGSKIYSEEKREGKKYNHKQNHYTQNNNYTQNNENNTPTTNLVSYQIPLIHKNIEGLKYVESRMDIKGKKERVEDMMKGEIERGNYPPTNTLLSLSGSKNNMNKSLSFLPPLPPLPSSSSSSPITLPSSSLLPTRSSRYLQDALSVVSSATQSRKSSHPNTQNIDRDNEGNVYKNYRPMERSKTPEWVEEMAMRQEDNDTDSDPFSTYITHNTPLLSSLLLLQSHLRGRYHQQVVEESKFHMEMMIEEIKRGEKYKIMVDEREDYDRDNDREDTEGTNDEDNDNEYIDENDEEYEEYLQRHQYRNHHNDGISTTSSAPFYHDYENMILYKSDTDISTTPILYTSHIASHLPSSPLPTLFSRFLSHLILHSTHLTTLSTLHHHHHALLSAHHITMAKEEGRRWREEEEMKVRMRIMGEKSRGYSEHAERLVGMMMAKAMDTYGKEESEKGYYGGEEDIESKEYERKYTESKENNNPMDNDMTDLDHIITYLTRDIIFPQVEFRMGEEGKRRREEKAREEVTWDLWGMITEEVERRVEGEEQEGGNESNE